MAGRLGRRWGQIFDKAGSESKYERVSALALAGSSVELAISAVGVPKKKFNEPVSSRLKDHKDKWHVPGAPELQVLLDAFKARNRAIHEAVVSETDDCHQAVSTLFDTWNALRRTVVTRKRAAEFARLLVESNMFVEAMLFGSLARVGGDPRDIDLLLIDHGDFSWQGGYGAFGGVARVALEGEGLLTDELRCAIDAGWLDFAILDDRIHDSEYIREVVKAQPDPLFLLNASEHLLCYDRGADRWAHRDPGPLDRFASIRAELVYEGILDPQMSKAEMKKPLRPSKRKRLLALLERAQP